jgi:TldD protein
VLATAHDGVAHIDAIVRGQGAVLYRSGRHQRHQQRVRIGPEFSATAIDKESGRFDTMRTNAPPVGAAGVATGADGAWD